MIACSCAPVLSCSRALVSVCVCHAPWEELKVKCQVWCRRHIVCIELPGGAMVVLAGADADSRHCVREGYVLEKYRSF